MKQSLDQDRIDATVRGTFYLKGRFRTRRMPYEATGAIPLGKDADAKADARPGAPAAQGAPGTAKAPPPAKPVAGTKGTKQNHPR